VKAPADQPDVMLLAEGLTKRYGEITALDDLDLTIPTGKVLGFIGHNGAGKTTTIRILAGLLKPTAGRAVVAGVELTGDSDRLKQRVGYMPDEFGVYDQMRVWEYLDFFGAAFRIGRRRRRPRIDEVLEITAAAYLRDRFVDTLSKGMKQKVGIARTLMHDPQLLLLDEPANGLDPRARIEMRQLLRDLADRGKTLLVSSHILPELASVCDRVGIIHKGHLQAAGTLAEVLGSLRRDRLMELKTVGDVADVAAALAADGPVSDIDTQNAAQGIVRYRFSGDDTAHAGLLAGLIDAGVRIATCREVPLSLEDAFMALSGISDAADDDPPRADESEGDKP